MTSGFKTIDVQVGPKHKPLMFKIKCIDDLNRAIDELFDTNSDLTNEKNVPYYGNLWPAGLALADHMARMGNWLEGKKVIELGCGLALPSLVCAKLGASVIAQDIHPNVETLLNENISNNSINPQTIQYKSFLFQDTQMKDLQSLGQFDFVIASDVLYEKNQPENIARIATALCSRTGHIILIDPARNPKYLQNCVDAIKSHDFRAETLTKDELFIFSFQKV